MNAELGKLLNELAIAQATNTDVVVLRQLPRHFQANQWRAGSRCIMIDDKERGQIRIVGSPRGETAFLEIGSPAALVAAVPKPMRERLNTGLNDIRVGVEIIGD